jgi:DNA-binding HxlR family transcriptional regulator
MKGFTYVGKLSNSFICDKRLSPFDFRVFFIILKWDTWDKPVTIEKMADEIGISTKSFGRSVKKLEELKYIKVERNTNWETFKYSIHSKAHKNESPVDKNESPLIDGNESPLLIKTSNIKERKKKEKPTPAKIELPGWLDKEVWAEWVEYRKEIKKKLTPSMISKQLKFLEKHNGTHAAIIEQSIQNGWTGLFPLKEQDKPVSQPAYYDAL